MVSEKADIDKFVVVGDRVLIKPKTTGSKTKTGLYLPPGIHEKEKVHSGYIIKSGPGYPIPHPVDSDEAWKKDEGVKYIPLQVKEGDLAIYLQKETFEIEFNREKFVIAPQAAILLLIRDDGLFD